jgi:hypothetical protein
MNKMKKITLFTLFLYTLTIYAQDPNILWQRTIGGSDWDEPTFIIPTTDQGFFIGGSSKSNISGEKTENSRGGYDYWVLKFDSSGNIEWQKTIGGDKDDRLSEAKQTTDGGYILVGNSRSDISGDKTENSQGGQDYWIIKLDTVGNITWQNTIGGDDDDGAGNVELTDDGGYLIGGTSNSSISGDRTLFNSDNSDAWIVKLDESGNILWQRAHSPFGNFRLISLKLTSDGGYVLGGDDLDFSSYTICKISINGNTTWSKLYGGDNEEFFSKLIITSDGGYMAIGHSYSNASGDKTEDSRGGPDYWILKLDDVGNIEWQKTIGGDNGDAPYAVIQTNDNGYFLAGYSYSNISGEKTENTVGPPDFWIMKLNSVGIIEWQNNIGGAFGERLPRSIINDDGSFTITGQSSSDISGDKTENSRGSNDFWIIKHAATLGLEENPFASAITLYPNPVKNTLQLNTQDQTINQINIYTITGSKILQLEVNTVSPTVDVSSLASGVYYVQLYSGKNVALKKFVKE